MYTFIITYGVLLGKNFVFLDESSSTDGKLFLLVGFYFVHNETKTQNAPAPEILKVHLKSHKKTPILIRFDDWKSKLSIMVSWEWCLWCYFHCLDTLLP